MIFCGVDPGSVSGAIGFIHGADGSYIDSWMIQHKDKHILALAFKSRILGAIPPDEAAEIGMESVHSMPNQGVASTFQFGRAVGVISAVCELTRYPFHLVTPQKWKRYFGLTKDKNEALDMARMYWPEAKLKLKKDINRAEALLIAQWLRHQINGKE